MLPRYRRPLTFSGLLDETFNVYRAAWPRFVGASAAALVPFWGLGLVIVVAFGIGALLTARGRDFGPGDFTPRFIASLVSAGVLSVLLAWVSFLVWGAALTLLAEWQLEGQGTQRTIWQAYRGALGRLLALTGMVILFALRLIGLALLAIPLLVIGLGGLLGGLVAGIGLLVWWLNPRARQTWLKWLIILATPFGLPTYYSVRWCLAAPAIMLEGQGPGRALGRSANLVAGHWFRTFGILAIVGLIVGILQSLPSALFSFLALIVSGVGSSEVSMAANLLGNAGQLVGLVLFDALSPISLTLLLVDLRNRHEGADLSERVALLEEADGAPVAPAAPPGILPAN